MRASLQVRYRLTATLQNKLWSMAASFCPHKDGHRQAVNIPCIETIKSSHVTLSTGRDVAHGHGILPHTTPFQCFTYYQSDLMQISSLFNLIAVSEQKLSRDTLVSHANLFFSLPLAHLSFFAHFSGFIPSYENTCQIPLHLLYTHVHILSKSHLIFLSTIRTTRQHHHARVTAHLSSTTCVESELICSTNKQLTSCVLESKDTAIDIQVRT